MENQLPEKIAVFVPDMEAKQFLLFQQHYEIFNVLLSSGVFNHRNCSITLNFDNDGVLRDIKKTDSMYSRKRSSVDKSSQ